MLKVARVPARAWWVWGPNRVRWVGPSSSLRGTQIGFGGTWWDPVGPSPSLRGDPTPRLGFTMLIRVRGGPMMAIFTAL